MSPDHQARRTIGARCMTAALCPPVQHPPVCVLQNHAAFRRDEVSCAPASGFEPALATLAQQQLETDVDTSLAVALERQCCGGAADFTAMDANRAEAWRNQPPHLEVA